MLDALLIIAILMNKYVPVQYHWYRSTASLLQQVEQGGLRGWLRFAENQEVYFPSGR